MLSLDKYADSIVTQLKPPRSRRYGTLTRIVGLTLEAKGVSAAVGSICRILRPDGEHVDAQVVGFESGSVYLMPLWQATGLSAGCRVYVHKETDTALVGDGLLGRVVDAIGEPLDTQPKITGGKPMGLSGSTPNPMERTPIDKVLDVGIRTLNALLTLSLIHI